MSWAGGTEKWLLHSNCRQTPSTLEKTSPRGHPPLHTVSFSPQNLTDLELWLQVREKKLKQLWINWKAQAPMWSRIFSGWGIGGKGILLVQHYSQVNFKIKAYRNITSASHLWGRKLRRQLTGIVQRETTSTIYLDVCAMVGTNYILCSVGPKPKQKQNQNKNPPNPKKAARRNARSLTEHTDPDGGG